MNHELKAWAVTMIMMMTIRMITAVAGQVVHTQVLLPQNGI